MGKLSVFNNKPNRLVFDISGCAHIKGSKATWSVFDAHNFLAHSRCGGLIRFTLEHIRNQTQDFISMRCSAVEVFFKTVVEFFAKLR